MTEWFERWFGEEYLALYPHRDDAEAEHAAGLLARHGIGGPGQRVLDLACGAGRHVRALGARGAHVFGYDLSATLLRAAREAGARRLVRGDMRRLALRSGAFDAVVNLFTSFGYFADDAEHATVLIEVGRVLKPGGRFALDFLTPGYVRAKLVACDERTVEGRHVRQERALSADGRYVEKTIRVDDDPHPYVERVRLFDRAELERLVAAAGMTVREVFGDYDGAAHAATSPRTLLLAERH